MNEVHHDNSGVHFFGGRSRFDATRLAPHSSIVMCANDMKRSLAAVTALLASIAVAGEEQTIIGTPTIDSTRIVTIRECSTGKNYKVGVMASNPYFRFSNGITELSKTGNVLVKIQGVVVGNDGLEITHPVVMSITQEACGEAGT